MEPLIQEIIAKDLAARKEVAQVVEEKKNIKKRVEARKDEIFVQKQQEAELRFSALKKRNEATLAKAREQKTLEYEAASAKLKKAFSEKEEAWIKELVQRCIHA